MTQACGDPWQHHVLFDRGDEHGERDVPDGAEAVPAAVRHVHGQVAAVADHRQAHPERH